MAAGDLSSALPAELRADVVIVLDGQGAWPGMQPGKLAVVVEVQTAPDEGKRRVWPAYLTLARAQHVSPAVLVVICRDRATGRWARRPIVTGHPGFDLLPLVIDADTMPALSGPGLAVPVQSWQCWPRSPAWWTWSRTLAGERCWVPSPLPASMRTGSKPILISSAHARPWRRAALWRP
jgi:hypothetical protein